jgi:hypothetical protein
MLMKNVDVFFYFCIPYWEYPHFRCFATILEPLRCNHKSSTGRLNLMAMPSTYEFS